MASIRVVEGDLLDQPVEAIVNAWNRNFIPWWLLLPQGVSGAIKKRGGYAPFRELSRHGTLKLGEAVVTSAGELPFKAIIHVACLHAYWIASVRSVRLSAENALQAAMDHGFTSLGFPLLGAGTGGLKPERSEALIREAAEQSALAGDVRIVRYRPGASNG